MPYNPNANRRIDPPMAHINISIREETYNQLNRRGILPNIDRLTDALLKNYLDSVDTIPLTFEEYIGVLNGEES